jgi:hypothetical protein
MEEIKLSSARASDEASACGRGGAKGVRGGVLRPKRMRGKKEFVIHAAIELENYYLCFPANLTLGDHRVKAGACRISVENG